MDIEVFWLADTLVNMTRIVYAVSPSRWQHLLGHSRTSMTLISIRYKHISTINKTGLYTLLMKIKGKACCIIDLYIYIYIYI